MRVSFKQLKKMLVETVSGTHLGKVDDLIMDTDGQVVLQYHVSSGLMSGHEYLITREQVHGFEEKKLIVDDNIKKIKVSPVKPNQASLPQAVVSMRDDAV